MTSPPNYSPPQSQHETLPPYCAAHAFADSTEELAALQDFAQSEKYINPGKDGSLPDIATGVRWVALEQPEAKEERRQLREIEKARKAMKMVEKPRQGSVSHKLRKIISREKAPSLSTDEVK